MDDLKSQNIISCPGSLLHGLGVWADHKLQEVTQKTISNFRNSLELKKQPHCCISHQMTTFSPLMLSQCTPTS